MQNLPDRNILLQATAGFLMEQVLPAVDDRGLRFRVRIAAHLLATVSRELLDEDGDDAAQLARLGALLGSPGAEDGLGRDARHAQIRDLEAAVADAARQADPTDPRSAPLLSAIRADLRARLQVVSPHFSTAPDIEGEGA